MFGWVFLTYRYLILNNTRNYSGRDSLSQSCVSVIPNSQLQLPGPEEGFQKLRRLTGSWALSKVSLKFFESAHIYSGGEKQKCDFLEVKGNTFIFLEVQQLVLLETLQWWDTRKNSGSRHHGNADCWRDLSYKHRVLWVRLAEAAAVCSSCMLQWPESRPLWGRKTNLRFRWWFFGSPLNWGSLCDPPFLTLCGRARATGCPQVGQSPCSWSSPKVGLWKPLQLDWDGGAELCVPDPLCKRRAEVTALCSLWQLALATSFGNPSPSQLTWSLALLLYLYRPPAVLSSGQSTKSVYMHK